MHADQRSGTCWGEPDLLRDRREVIAPLGEVSQRRESKLPPLTWMPCTAVPNLRNQLCPTSGAVELQLQGTSRHFVACVHVGLSMPWCI